MKKLNLICCLIFVFWNSSINVSFAGANKEDSNNIITETKCEGLRSFLKGDDTASLYKKLNLSESKIYNEKQLSYKEEKRDAWKTGIDNIAPTIKMSNGNSWENGTVTRNNQLLISGETKLFAATGKWLTSYIGDGERKQLARVSVLEEVETQLAKLLDGSPSEKTTAYLFLKRIIKEEDLGSKVKECYGGEILPVTKSLELTYEKLLKDREQDKLKASREQQGFGRAFGLVAAPLVNSAPLYEEDDICTPSPTQRKEYNKLYLSLMSKESLAATIEDKFAKIPFKSCQLMRLAYLQTLI